MPETFLTFILVNSKFLRRKTAFSTKRSLPLKTTASACDVMDRNKRITKNLYGSLSWLNKSVELL